MKRLWLACLAIAAVTTSASTANAQFNNQSPEIGSYQSILSRTGYQTPPGSSSRGTIPGSLPGHLTQAAPPAVAPYTPQSSGSGSRDAAPTNYGHVIGNSTTSPCGGSGCGGNVTGDSIVSYADSAQGCASGSCGDPVYTPGANIGSIVENAPNANDVNRVGSIFGVVLRRNYADPVRIGGNSNGDIFSSDIDHGDFEGLGISLAGRKADGTGREIIYWGLDDDTDTNFNLAAGATSDFFSIGQLNDLAFPGSTPTVFENFNNATNLSVYRDTEINSIETNLLRNGGSYRTRHGRSGNIELLGGFRLFQFDESLRIVGSGAPAPNPATTEYRLAADNFLIGAQLGARNEICLSQRFRLTSGINVGLFNNRSETRQQVFNQDGTFATVAGDPTREFNYEDTQDDVAIMGEFKVGLIMQFSDRIRGNIGYQALGVSGVALSEDQIPLNATDGGLLSRSNTNGSLLLHGVYFGAEACF